jgi:triacylglycerol lipase
MASGAASPRFSAIFFTATVLASSAACSGDDTRDDSESSISVTTGVSGSGGSRGTTHASATSATATTGMGGAGGAMGGPPYPIVLAHGFFGFNDFAGAGFLTYFYQVKDYLAQHGETVYTPAVDPFNDSTYRGAQLATAIDQIRSQTGAAKVVIIGHSQGGLDARVVAHDHPEEVAAVITIATPHYGTPIADVAVKLLQDNNFKDIVDALVNLIGAPLYDQIGTQTAVSKPLYLFSQPGIAAFNAAYPDAPGVFYASLSGRSDLNYGGQDCAPDKKLPFIEGANGEADPVDPTLLITAPILDGNGPQPFVHDGLVRAVDARWGEFWGCVPADHLDEVGQLFGDSPGLGNSWQYKDFYLSLVQYIRQLGY